MDQKIPKVTIPIHNTIEWDEEESYVRVKGIKKRKYIIINLHGPIKLPPNRKRKSKRT